MPITGQFSRETGEFRSSCGCATLIQARRAQPLPPCPICMRATTWSGVEVPVPAAPAKAAQPAHGASR